MSRNAIEAGSSTRAPDRKATEAASLGMSWRNKEGLQVVRMSATAD